MSQAAIQFEDLHVDEEWRDIPNIPGYQASNMGRIRSIKFGKFHVHKPALHGRADGYKRLMLCTSKFNTNVGRLVLMAFVRLPNELEECDHINRNALDNRIENLRWASRSENLLNRKSYGNSKFKGVSKIKHVYRKKDGTLSVHIRIRGQITLNKKRIKLGDFKTEEEAHQAYLTAFKNHYGYDCPI